ncbi:MAG TPA: ABC transporter permease [Terriglobales bacterium]|nr:ABC transporter permease [Terriglobales bacterium]
MQGRCWSRRFISDFARALGESGRRLRRAPGSAAIAATELAVAAGLFFLIGALFTRFVVLPLRGESKSLVVLWQTKPGVDGPHQADFEAFRMWRASLHTIKDIVAFDDTSDLLDPLTDPRRVTIEHVSRGFFRVFGMRLLSGGFAAQPKADEAVLSERLWREVENGRATGLGTTLQVGSHQYRVVGTVRDQPYPGDADIWVPLQEDVYNRANHTLTVVGGLALGADLDSCRAELAAWAKLAAPHLPFYDYAWSASAQPLADYLLGSSRAPLDWAAGAALILLLLATLVAASLLVCRSNSRLGELAIRRALGAGPLRLFLDASAEPILIVLFACVAGTVIAELALSPTWSLVAGVNAPRLQSATPGLWMILIAGATFVALAVAAALAVTIPAMRATETGTLMAGQAPTRRRLGSRMLPAASAALCVWILWCTIPSVAALQKVEFAHLGFSTSGLQVSQFAIHSHEFTSGSSAAEALASLLQAARASGVSAAGLTSDVPFGRHQEVFRFWAAGGSGFLTARYRAINPGYLPMLRVKVVRGRNFTRSDTRGGPLVLIVNSAWARLFGPGGHAVGKRLSIDGPVGPWRTVVGVVDDARDQTISLPPSPEMYFPIPQELPWAMSLVLHDSPGARITPTQLRAIYRSSGTALLPYSITTVGAEVAADAAAPVALGALLGLAGLLGLAVAALGIFAATSRIVQERDSENGIRIALGATRRGLCLQLVRANGISALAGGGAGVVSCLWATNLLRSVAPGWTGPPIPIMIVAAVGAVALCAASTAVAASRSLRFNAAALLRRP